MAHDANLPSTSTKALALFDVIKQINGGFIQGIVPPISFTTAALYGALIALGLGSTTVFAVGMASTFCFAFFLAVTGFEWLFVRWGRPATWARLLDATLVAAVYIVAPFTLVYVSYGVFWAINVALAIGVMPAMVYLFLRCFDDERDQFQWKSIAALALCLIVVAWSILFILPTMLILCAFFALICFDRGINRVDLYKVGALGALVLVGALPSIYGMYLSVFDPGWTLSSSSSVMVNAAYGNIKGGVLTGFLQYSGWPIYTLWSPRLLLGFHTHFVSPIYIWLTTLLLVVVTAIPLVIKKRRYLFSFVMLLVALFFVKAAGPPLGILFKLILFTVPGAGLIRTPDTKFGIFVILAIAIAITILLADTSKLLLGFRTLSRLLALAVVTYHAAPFVNGQAILGVHSELVTEDADNNGYAVTLTQAERRIIKKLQDEPIAGVVILPPSMAINVMRPSGFFSYRHVIGEFISNDIYLAGLGDVTNSKVDQRVQSAIEEGDWQQLPNYGVGFVLLNNNTVPKTASHYGLYHVIRTMPNIWHKVIDAGGYELFRLIDSYRKPVIAVTNGQGTRSAEILDRGNWFIVYNPPPSKGSKFTVTFASARNAHWRLIMVPTSCNWSIQICSIFGLIAGSNNYSIRKDPHSSEFQNRWKVEKKRSQTPDMPSSQNGDHTTWMIVFLPQILMYFALIMSIGIVLLCIYLAVRKGTRPGGSEVPPKNSLPRVT